MENTPLDIHQIRKRLPHRYPFLMIDRILERSQNEALALKNVTINEPYFQGHFPNEPIVPGVLIGEAMAQAAAFIGGDGGDGGESMGDKAFLTGMNLKIEKPVVPGDQLLIKVRLIKRLGKLMKFSAQGTVGKAVVAIDETGRFIHAHAPLSPAHLSASARSARRHRRRPANRRRARSLRVPVATCPCRRRR